MLLQERAMPAKVFSTNLVRAQGALRPEHLTLVRLSRRQRANVRLREAQWQSSVRSRRWLRGNLRRRLGLPLARQRDLELDLRERLGVPPDLAQERQPARVGMDTVEQQVEVRFRK